MKKMLRKIPSIFLCIFLIVFFSLYFSGEEIRPSNRTKLKRQITNHQNSISITREHHHPPSNTRHVFSITDELPIDSIILPDWEILLIVSSPENQFSSDPDDPYYCLFQNNATSPAHFAGFLPFSKLKTYRCILPNSLHRYRTIRTPILTKSTEIWPENDSESPEPFRWNFLTYESLSTEKDLILFVKGVNNHQGVNRSPSELRCLFDNGVNTSVITAVTISAQEVFRCFHPNDTEIHRLFPNGDEKIKVSLQVEENEKKWVVPSVAYYTPSQRNVVAKEEKELLCACTMVYNVAKFLKEWVIYNSKLGVEKFILYDNGSEDELQKVVDELLEDSYNVEKIFWPWPKTQEAGFSHSAMHAMGSCKWMMYVDVDEFIFSPKWLNSPHPSQNMLRSLLPNTPISSSSSSSSTNTKTGQVSIGCLEYGPSNQKSHPIHGVTQGYTCRRRIEQRHKSIVLLDAIDTSLLNVIHHFQLKDGYKMRKLSKEEGLVNHYKYQAWSEFKVKFRRRVSTYVVDWKTKLNPLSKDRTPGLGFEAVEPKDWDEKFCEVHDNRLKMITQKWFGFVSSINGYKMVWEDKRGIHGYIWRSS